MTSEPCFSILRKPKGFESANEISLKRMIEGNDLEKCEYGLEDLLQNLLDGEKFPTNLMMSVINRYQMNKFSGDVGNRDKRIKKLLYILWECLPKRGPDGKFLDRMVMVCGAFDNDLKHPNEFVCGNVSRTLGKTREPEVIRELIHSIEKCLKLTHSYPQRNAVLAIAQIHKNFPDLNPSTPKLISEYLMEARDDGCKRAALQALLEIDPHEAKPYLHSSNIQDIHTMNVSIQLLFVEIIQKIIKTCQEDESRDYISILKSLITLSPSPSVRYQAATTLMRFSRDPDTIKLVACCFIDICSKDSDNNVKLVALDSLMKLRRINGADRVIRGSIMDILFILQTASDVELQEKVLKLTFDLISPLNVGGVVSALRQEIEKHASDPEKAHYRRLLVGAAYNIAERYPKAIIEYELLDTLFKVLTNSATGEKVAAELILLFKVFMTKNPYNRATVLSKIQDSFNIITKSQTTHQGLIQLLGEFSETKEQIEKTYMVLKDSLGELPIVGSELRKAAQREEEASGGAKTDSENKQSTANGDVDMVTKSMKRLVTADGSYAAQSAINYSSSAKGATEEHPPLRQYYLENKFGTASVLCYALLKMACRYQDCPSTSKAESNGMIAKFMLIMAAILNLGHSKLTDSEGNILSINTDHSENLMMGLSILQNLQSEDHSEVAKLMKRIVTNDIRSQLNLSIKNVDKGFMQESFKTKQKTMKMDDPIRIGLLTSRDDYTGYDEETDDEKDLSHISMPTMFSEIPLTGTIDAIYAYCVFDVGQYDVGLRIHLENRTPHTLENVTLELAARGENVSNSISRPDPIVLAPRAAACITSNIKVVSAENRRLFGSITFDDTSKIGTEDKEQVIMLNDISVNITDYIRPASTTYDEFREVWRDCEWENKVAVKTKLSNLKDYLMLLVTATDMRCVTAERCLSGDCMFLSANMYARSAFGEEALVNVSIEKEAPQSAISGTVKIRSRSQGMALSLGDKISSAQNASCIQQQGVY